MLSENTEELMKAKDDFEAHMQSCSDASGTKQYEFSNGVKVFVKKPRLVHCRNRIAAIASDCKSGGGNPFVGSSPTSGTKMPIEAT